MRLASFGWAVRAYFNRTKKQRSTKRVVAEPHGNPSRYRGMPHLLEELDTSYANHTQTHKTQFFAIPVHLVANRVVFPAISVPNRLLIYPFSTATQILFEFHMVCPHAHGVQSSRGKHTASIKFDLFKGIDECPSRPDAVPSPSRLHF